MHLVLAKEKKRREKKKRREEKREGGKERCNDLSNPIAIESEYFGIT